MTQDTELPTQAGVCPFCKSTAARASFVRISDDLKWHHVECGNCFAVGPHRSTSSEAIAAWGIPNRIASTPAASDAVERVPTALREFACTVSKTESTVTIDCDDADEANELFDWLAAMPPLPDLTARLVEALETIKHHAETRIQDGDEMDARVWRIALVDILAEALSALTEAKAQPNG